MVLRNYAGPSLFIASFAILACGSGSSDSASTSGGGINFSSGGSSSAGVSGNGSGGLDPDSACVGTSVEGERVPVDLYFMVDTTGSMNCPVPDAAGKPCTVDPKEPYAETTRWVVESAALRSFMDSRKNDGLGVGIGFFPSSRDVCNASTYKTPAVEIATLPGAAASLDAAIAAKKPAGTTPTLASLTGAVQHASEYAKAHVGHRVAVVYSTDGYPMGCDANNTIANAAKVAHDAFTANPSVPVYVLALGNNLTALNEIAASGGTEKAYQIDTSSDAAGQLSAALDSIRGRALVGCTYEIPSPPAGEQIDYNMVNVRVTSGAGKVSQVYQSPAGTSCEEGWQYSADKTEINLCGETCEQVKNDPGAKLDVLFGCTTQVVLR